MHLKKLLKCQQTPTSVLSSPSNRFLGPGAEIAKLLRKARPLNKHVTQNWNALLELVIGDLPEHDRLSRALREKSNNLLERVHLCSGAESSARVLFRLGKNCANKLA